MGWGKEINMLGRHRQERAPTLLLLDHDDVGGDVDHSDVKSIQRTSLTAAMKVGSGRTIAPINKGSSRQLSKEEEDDDDAYRPPILLQESTLSSSSSSPPPPFRQKRHKRRRWTKLLEVTLFILYSLSLTLLSAVCGAFIHQSNSFHPTPNKISSLRSLSSLSCIHLSFRQSDDTGTSMKRSRCKRSSRLSLSADDSHGSASSSSSSDGDMPKHVAFICDGNSRWAKSRNLPTSVGHVVGADRLVDLLEILKEDGVEYCTLYGFSTENWKRSPSEIRDIFQVIERTARKTWKRIIDESPHIQIKLLGDLDDPRIPLGLRTILKQLQSMTEKNIRKNSVSSQDKKLTVCLAVNYGGRQDIIQATKRIAQDIASGQLSSEDVINEKLIAEYLSTAGMPDPDMIVRTSGEHRLSNFLLWNCAYSEIYITDKYWPDFDGESWLEALQWYQQRQRRFGSRITPKDIDDRTRMTFVPSSEADDHGITKAERLTTTTTSSSSSILSNGKKKNGHIQRAELLE